jgi:Fic-DOC domain mobile mystery protein B
MEGWRLSDVFDGFGGEDDAATPLTYDEKKGLKPAWVTYRHELNEVEQFNILDGTRWAARQRQDPLAEDFLRELHRKMLGDVWEWAGEYRDSDRNIGVDPWKIRIEMRTLIDDVRYWIDHKSFEPDELVVRFHHRLVHIHPFPNGNGRHARLAADLLIKRLGGKPFSWASGSIADTGEIWKSYSAALREADEHDIRALIAFARS